MQRGGVIISTVAVDEIRFVKMATDIYFNRGGVAVDKSKISRKKRKYVNTRQSGKRQRFGGLNRYVRKIAERR